MSEERANAGGVNAAEAQGVTLPTPSTGPLADPYPTYHRLRSQDPVHWKEAMGAWMITRYADAAAVLCDPRFTVDYGHADRYRADPNSETLRKLLVFRDPPDHTRLRALAHRAFSRRLIQRLQPRVQQVVDELLDRAMDRAVNGAIIDVISDLAYPLPLTVICETLGVPPQDQPTIEKWLRALARVLEPSASSVVAGEIMLHSAEAARAFIDYFEVVVAERRKSPKDDVVSNLVAAEENGARLSGDELVRVCIALLIAGHATTTNLIGNGLLALLRHPDQLAMLTADPSLAQSAVEELLRYDSSVQLLVRTALQDVEIGGKTIRARQRAMVMIGAANRDPEQFTDPDRLDITRSENRHLAFGTGFHFCLGAPLAREEAQIAIPTILQRMPGLHLAAEPEWNEALSVRGLKSLKVAFHRDFDS